MLLVWDAAKVVVTAVSDVIVVAVVVTAAAISDVDVVVVVFVWYSTGTD